MSYEGREQHICKAGHRFDTGCRYEDDLPPCPICQEPSVWYNAVDDTNCDSDGVILDWSSLLLTPAVVETCSLGHQHITKEATYRVPTEAELLQLRHYWNEVSGEYLPISSLPTEP